MTARGTARGIRNNNPGNIRGAGTRWKGMSGVDPDGYIVFATPLWGIRAMAKTLLTYRRKGICTVQGIVERWSPASDNNDVGAYAAHISKRVGVEATQTIDIAEHLSSLIQVMIKHECGSQPYPQQLIAQAIVLAKD